jgi:hypothetical protein
VKVIDVTDPERPRPISGATVEIADARSIYLVRTYAYVAAGKQGLAIVDIEQPERPRLDQVYDAEGKIDDAHDVKLGMTNVSLFAYIADGHNGLRVVQLTSPEVPGNDGFSPRPAPQLIATHHTHGPALAVSEGLDRDRGVDESGNQLSVFNRRGARPFNLTEMRRMYLKDGNVYVTPDIKDPGTRENKDIRRFFGAQDSPASRDSGLQTGSSSAGKSVPSELFGFIAIALPLALVLIRRKQSKQRIETTI